jgi:alpha-amylase
MRGGFWRNFQVTYREINDLHKQMLRVSRKVEAVVAAGADGPDPARVASIVDHLHRGQSNDCYWHGLFGGIYLAHLRLATLAHLIAAEDGADRLAAELAVEPAPEAVAEPVAAIAIEMADFDIDGTDEVLVRTPGQVVLVKPSEGGGIGSWDVRAPRHALASVMRRRPEAYHETLQAVEKGEDLADQGAVSIDDQVKVTESGLSTRLWYDAYERR